MAFIGELRRGDCLGPLAILHLGVRRPCRNIDLELDQEVHGPPSLSYSSPAPMRVPS